MDAHWWLERTGRLATTIDTVDDPGRVRREPSLQLAGRAPDDPRGETVDLATVQALGVELVGRLRVFSGRVATFADDLATTVGDSERRQAHFLDLVDSHVETSHLASEVGPADRPRPVPVPDTRDRIDLRAAGIGSVVIATGYAPHHPWLKVPVTDRHGVIRQHRGATPVRGLYVVGQRFQHRRDGGTLDGARHDALDVVGSICADDCVALRSLELR
jgi:putative flavoprotein involved in K+ transport